ncbi:MAG: TIM44-like domain-containing protein [Desulfosporosinus sp.]|nr:TIM44-like domain-containing protein [Desulfosporosinus sp.]
MTRKKRIEIAIISLMLLVSQASLALARGGGGVGGSLGGSAGGFSGGSISGRGFSGGSSGGLGGFFPLPFFFFGGSSSGGSGSGGLFGFLFFMVILYFIFKALRSSRRGGTGRSSTDRGLGKGGRDDFSGEMPVDLTGCPITNSDNLQRFGKSINFTRENMRYFSETFPRWDRDFLIGRVRQVFFWLQDAWSRQDLSAANEYLTTILGNKYRTDLQGMKARGERNMIKEPVLNTGDIEFIQSHLDEQTQHFMAMVSASLIDYTVDASGRQISGDNTHRLYYTEFWEFVWQDDRWLLSNIYQEDALEVAKIARGEDE